MKPLLPILVRSELGAGTRGSSLGPMSVLIADHLQDRFFSNLKMEFVPETYAHLPDPDQPSKAKAIRAIIKHTENVSNCVFNACSSGAFPMVISGDHSNAYGTIAGLKKFIGDKSLGVIWIDAHADLHSPFTTPSGNMHGMPLGMALGEDHGKSGEFNGDWDQLVELETGKGKITPKDISFIGLRDTEAPENEIINSNNILNIPVQEMRDLGVVKAANKALENLSHCDHIYISFDVDSMDPDTVSRGTGTPVPGGIFLDEAIALNANLMEDERVIAWEMTEVNPLLDIENKMGRSALQVVYGVLDVLKSKK